MDEVIIDASQNTTNSFNGNFTESDELSAKIQSISVNGIVTIKFSLAMITNLELSSINGSVISV